MKKLLVCLAIVGLLAGFVPDVLAATNRHDRGAVVVDTKGTVYFIGENTRYPFPSMDVFTSWGHKPSDIKKAKSGDLALTLGAIAEMNRRPFGHLDEIKLISNGATVRGWVIDKARNQDTDLNLLVSVDGPYTPDNDYYNDTYYSASTSQTNRPDVNLAYGISGNYGFEVPLPLDFLDGLPHTLYVYTYDWDDTENSVLLNGSPLHFTLSLVSEMSKPEISYFDVAVDTYYSYDNKFTVGQSVELDWGVNDATTVTLDGVVVPAQGSKTLTPTGTTTFNLVATNSAGSVSESITLTARSAGEARDYERFEQVMEILWGVYDYQAANGTFPDSLQALVPTYLDSVPVAPTPADGSCSTTDNNYVYTRLTNPSNYTFKFCLGSEISNIGEELDGYFEAGVNTINYAQALAEAQAKGSDARRLADVRQMMTGLELYYNDYNAYPSALSSLAPSIITTIPTAPLPSATGCSDSDNTYTYTQLSSGQSYQLKFCLGGITGGYSAGIKTASPNGIN